MKTYCLVIDDDNQEEYFETNIRKVLQKDHIELTPVFIKPKDRKYMKADYSGFDRNLIEKDCLEKIKEHNCTVVVSDYEIATKDDNFNGLDILNAITEKYPNLFKILYSGGKIKEAIRKLYNTLENTVHEVHNRMTDEQMVDTFDQLKKVSNINETISGKGYAEAVVKYIRCAPLILQQQMLYQLKVNYPEMVFQSCFPAFNGKKLKEIGEEIEKRSLQGGDFQQALIEQVLSYLITVNEK